LKRRIRKAAVKNTNHATWTLYRWTLSEAWPYRLQIGVVLFLSLLSIPLELLTPLPLMIAADSVIGEKAVPGFLQAVLPAAVTYSKGTTLVFAAVLFAIIALSNQLRNLTYGILSAHVGEKLVLNLRARLLRHAQRLSLLHHDAKGTANSTFRIQWDALAIRWIVMDGGIPLLTASLTIVGMIYVTASIDPSLALVALAVSPVLFVVLRVYNRRLRHGWHAAKTLESSLLARAQEVLGAVRVVKAFGQERMEEERFVRRASQNVRTHRRLAFLQGLLGLIVGVTTAIGMGIVLFIGAQHVLAGTLTLGSLLLVMGYLTQLYKPLEDMSQKTADLQESLASAERAVSLLDEAPDVIEKANARPLSRTTGAVAFCDVSFAYREDNPVLHDVSFEVEPGTRVGISGTTGAGKSTLMNLLTRFYDPTAGRILLDGVDLRDYKLADLRNQFAIVLQEPVLLSTSIAENIAYARPGASEEEIVEAAKAANAHEFIVGLPRGYETEVGERGMSLSGGERQRIALARAFLKDAPILILDEPTSSVDTKTEATIMEAMERLMRGRTAFMVAHRLGTLANCDTRLQIENGRFVSSEGAIGSEIEQQKSINNVRKISHTGGV